MAIRLGLGIGLTSRHRPPGGVSVPSITTTTLLAFGDSRLQKGLGFTSSGATYSLGVSHSGSMIAAALVALQNKILISGTGGYAVGASTTRNGTKRISVVSNASTGNTAQTDTADSADAAFNLTSTGEYSPVTDPANVVLYHYGTNDGSYATWFTSPLVTMQEITSQLDTFVATGKVVLLLNEIPRGKGFVQGEVKTVTSLACQATQTSSIVDVRLLNKDTGQVYTKVGTLTATGQYTVSATGAYAFFTGDTIATAQLYYYYGTTTSGVYLNTVHNWLSSSSASPFVDPDSGTSYAIPGALYGRGSNVVLVDSWGALKNPATSGSATTAIDGMLTDNLHYTTRGAYAVGAAIKIAFETRFPAATRLDQLPTKNAYVFATGTGAQTRFPAASTTTLPTQGMVPIAPGTLKVIAGTVIGTDTNNGDGTFTITGTGIAGGTGTYATGAMFVQFSVAPANGIKVIVSTDAGANLLDNGLFDISHGTGTITPTGVTGSLPKGWTLTVDTDTQAALTAATLSVGLTNTTNPDTGLPELEIAVQGVLGGTVGSLSTITLANIITTAATRQTAGEKYRAVGLGRLLPGAGGTLLGFSSIQIKGQSQSTIAVTRPGANNTSNTSVTIMAATMGANANGTPYDSQDLVAGQVQMPMVTQPIDTSGVTFNNTQHNILISFEKAKYVSFKARIGQAGLLRIS